MLKRILMPAVLSILCLLSCDNGTSKGPTSPAPANFDGAWAIARYEVYQTGCPGGNIDTSAVADRINDIYVISGTLWRNYFYSVGSNCYYDDIIADSIVSIIMATGSWQTIEDGVETATVTFEMSNNELIYTESFREGSCWGYGKGYYTRYSDQIPPADWPGSVCP